MSEPKNNPSTPRGLCGVVFVVAENAVFCANSACVAFAFARWLQKAKFPAFESQAGNNPSPFSLNPLPFYCMDPIADMLTAIRNALLVRKDKVTVPYSKIKYSLAQLLKDKGFVSEVNRKGRGVTDKRLEIVLKYDESGQPAISGLVRKSRPGQRLYIKKTRLKPVKQGFGIAILSTPKGLMIDREARKAGMGGEIVCEVW